MTKKSKRNNSKNNIQSNLTAITRASEFSEYHPIFEKYSKRKKLSPQEKGAVTRKWKLLLNVAYEAGGIGFVTPASKKVVAEIKKQKRTEILLGGFNIVKLNKYNDGKNLEINAFGDFVEKRKYAKADRDDLQSGRNITFVSVNCNFDFSTGRYDKFDSDEMQDKVKSLIIKRFWASYKKRAKKIPEAEYYLWGAQGVMYKRAASTFELLMTWLETWIELYLDRIIESHGAVSDELLGWCWHGNVRIRKPKAKIKGVKNGKKKNSRSRR